MKNLLIGLFILGLTSLSYSQNFYQGFESLRDIESKFDTSSISNSISLSKIAYLNRVDNKIQPHNIKQLELMAYNFDVKKLIRSNKVPKTFDVKFRNSKNYIIARYDQAGNILTTHEKFKNFKLPQRILKIISSNYPNWSITATTYKVYYNSKIGAKMRYTVKISKGKLKKKMHFDSNTKHQSEFSAVTSTDSQLVKEETPGME